LPDARLRRLSESESRRERWEWSFRTPGFSRGEVQVLREAILLQFNERGAEFLAEVLSKWVFPDQASATHAALILNEYTLRYHLHELGDFYCTAKVRRLLRGNACRGWGFDEEAEVKFNDLQSVYTSIVLATTRGLH